MQETFLQDGGLQPYEVPVRRTNVLPLSPAGHWLEALLRTGASPGGGKCPLWSDDKLLMERDVAKGASDIKTELPGVTLKHDPTKW